MSREEGEDEERRRQRELEEALEVKSLRRIISAYLNYPEAAEEDIKRYERSYKKLLPAHKELLAHYPLKFQKMRRCISMNSYFIFSMLQAFEPPLDMSQDMDICENQHLEHAHHDHHHGERHACSCQPTSISGRKPPLQSGQICCPERSSGMSRLPSEGIINEVLQHFSTLEYFFLDIYFSMVFLIILYIIESVFSFIYILFIEKLDLCRSQQEVHAEGHDSSGGNHPQHLENNKEKCGDDVHDSDGNVAPPRDWLDPSFQWHVPLVDVDKVRCIIRNIVRDWAAEGQKERDQCYKPILEELDLLFPNRDKESPPACLVPGAGLGRLALEISCLGFISQGNEFSYYMMICSSFILNRTQTVGEWTIYPWIHSNCNSLSDNDQLRPVTIPDILPASAGITEGFSMCGGDFVELYSDPIQIGMWDAVVTCFFIDTAHNIVEYIEIISRILKDGGVWINFGPLLYHFADMYGLEDDMSIELSLEDVRKVALHYGLKFEKENTVETTYTTNTRSMMQNRYYAAFWTMRKTSATAKEGSVS